MHTYINQWQSANYQPQGSLTPKEVATRLGVKTATVYAWLSRKEMQANRVGTRRFITEQQMNDFHSKRKTGEYVDLTYANGPVR
jgi:excisionase family DNA binding protein